MKYKVAEIEGALLDAAVAKAEGLPVHPGPGDFIVADSLDTVYAHERAFSRSWTDGGPIIERERIFLMSPEHDDPGGEWSANVGVPHPTNLDEGSTLEFDAEGATPLIAAMRAYVASKFGDEVELP